MSRFYVKPEDIRENEIRVSGPEAHHILDVMRLKKGDSVVTFDGLGTEYTGVISDVVKKSLVIAIEKSQKQPPLSGNITIAQAIPKSEKMYYIIQKCTELGVRAIIPMVTERTIVRIKKAKEDRRLARWARIATSAAKQCGRSDVPEIKEISSFKEVVQASSKYSLKVIPSLIGQRKELKEILTGRKGNDAIIFIGPEGGFTPAEVKLAIDSGISAASFGPYTLRSDTAPIAALAILMYELKNK